MIKKLVLSIVIALLSLPCIGVEKESWNIDVLLKEISVNKTFNYQYTEIKTMSFLQKPIVSKGQLSFHPPNILQKKTRYPKKSNYKIIEDRLIILREGKPKKEVLLSTYPELLALAESLRATFGGKKNILLKYYTLDLKGNRLNWKLTLVPTDIDLVEKIEFIEIQGRKDQLYRILIKEVDGDKSILKIKRT